MGGAEAGIGAASALELAGAATGVGLPIAAGIALVAAIFGGNHDNPANMPDKYDTQRFGQDVADLGGTAGANGQSFVEDPKLKALLGGHTGIAGVEETLAKYGSAANAPNWLAPMFDKLKAMFGISATGSGQLDFEHAIGNEWVSGAAGTDGQHYKYTDLANALFTVVNAAETASAAPTAASTTPTTRTIPDPTDRRSVVTLGPTVTSATVGGTRGTEIVAQRPETPAQTQANLSLVSTAYGSSQRGFHDERASTRLIAT